MKLEELEVYQLSLEIGERVWKIVIKWDYFAKDTIGKQLVKSADSIAANISEGFGRFSYKENKQFNYYARGSLFETKTWITKAKNRKLISEDDFLYFRKSLNNIGIKLNNYVKSIGQSKLEEPEVPYGDFFPSDDN
ncbi:MAG: four helix bundle protein [Bacteroidales bacterium]|nr:four helix bundle protein [Bacteroidales bacterium]